MGVDFEQLHGRLIDYLQRRVRSGEITERGLSRLTGVSQPHIHNVLKGKRVLSISRADGILRQLHLDVLDLLEPHELRERARR
ncbi:MAG TPA: helix-turn-helix transcriptional regulator [Bryobacteraceae bacterium]|nr:helix-turn-helix transcriptional regulator [Bryobacteraceae bacterium]